MVSFYPLSLLLLSMASIQLPYAQETSAQKTGGSWFEPPQNTGSNYDRNHESNYDRNPGSNYDRYPGSNYDRSHGSNYDRNPGYNYDRYPGYNYDRYPGHNYGRNPGSNYGRYPGSNYGRYPGSNYGRRHPYQPRGYGNQYYRPDRTMTTYSRDALFDLAAFHSYVSPNYGGGSEYEDVRGFFSPSILFDQFGFRRDPSAYGHRCDPQYYDRRHHRCGTHQRRPMYNPYSGGSHPDYQSTSPLYHKMEDTQAPRGNAYDE